MGEKGDTCSFGCQTKEEGDGGKREREREMAKGRNGGYLTRYERYMLGNEEKNADFRCPLCSGVSLVDDGEGKSAACGRRKKGKAQKLGAVAARCAYAPLAARVSPRSHRPRPPEASRLASPRLTSHRARHAAYTVPLMADPCGVHVERDAPSFSRVTLSHVVPRRRLFRYSEIPCYAKQNAIGVPVRGAPRADHRAGKCSRVHARARTRSLQVIAGTYRCIIVLVGDLLGQWHIEKR